MQADMLPGRAWQSCRSALSLCLLCRSLYRACVLLVCLPSMFQMAVQLACFLTPSYHGSSPLLLLLLLLRLP